MPRTAAGFGPSASRGHQVPDRCDGRAGDVVERGGDARAQMSVEPVSRAAARDGRHRPGRLGQVAADGVENVLVARADDDVRRHAGRGLGDPPGDEFGVALATAFRLAIGQVPLAMMLRGRPVRMRVVLRVRTVADLEPPGRTLIAGRVRDDVGAVPVGQHHHVGGAPGGGIGHLLQVRKRADPDRARVGAGREPPRQHRLAVRCDHDLDAACRSRPRAAFQRLGRGRIGAPLTGFADGVGPGHIPGVAWLTEESGTATVAVTTRSDPAEPGARSRSPGPSGSRPSRRSGCVMFE